MLDLKKLPPSFKSGIITGAKMLDQVVVSKNKKASSKIVAKSCRISHSDESIETLSTEIIGSGKEKNSSLKSKITLAAFSILGIILFASFLSTNYTKKEVVCLVLFFHVQCLLFLLHLYFLQ